MGSATLCDARTPQSIAIGATTLDRALTDLAAQTGTEIVSTEGGLSTVHVPTLSGNMRVAEALDRLLSGTGFRAIAAGRGYRVERLRVVRRALPRRSAPPSVSENNDDIIVSASKQEVRLLRFPASLIFAVPATAGNASPGERNLDGLAHATPILQTTELGPGRNKIFIRGIADSSFNGATQSTASVYFGDVQLVYSGAHPGLALHDVARVEIMEGPQGTLYGAGAIGGIIRIIPNPVDLARSSANMMTGVTTVLNGGIGGDVNGMLNLPILSDRIGVRMVGYYDRHGGAIDDRLRAARNIDASTTFGGRTDLRFDPGDDWSIDVGVIGQRILGDDGQYADSGTGTMSRSTAIAQPFGSDLLVGRAVVSRRWTSGLVMTAASGLSIRHIDDAFDASSLTGSPLDAQYRDIRDSRLLTLETRLSRSRSSGASWLLGATYLENRDIQNRTFGPVASPVDIISVTNVTQSASIFGETTVPFNSRFAATLGTRLTHARTDGEPSARVRSGEFVRGRSTTRLDPTVAFSWLLNPHISAFGRFQTGYRTGGLAVARGVGRVADFSSDTIRMGELGLRIERQGSTGVALTGAISYAHWSDIQADLLNRRGQPYTLNIGDADIVSFEVSGDWIPVVGFQISGAILQTRNRFVGTNPATASSSNQQLPETPAFSGNAALRYRWSAARQGEGRVGASIRYVGKSVLGPGDLLNISQGNFAVVGANAGWRHRRIDFSIVVDNLLNARSNRFSFGNPFSFAQRTETTPLEPLNIRFGVGIEW